MRWLLLSVLLFPSARATAQCPERASVSRFPEAPDGDEASWALRAQQAEENATGADADRDALLTAGRAYEALSRHSHARAHRGSAIRFYARFIQLESSAAPGADAVLFALGRLLIEQGQPDAARQMLHRLVQDHPTSPRLARAYTLFGDQAIDDPRVALLFYERAGETADAPLSAYLSYRRAWMHRALGDVEAARIAFAQVQRGAVPDLDGALSREACAFRP